MSKAQQTVLEIDLKALEHNYEFLRSKLRPETKFMAVVKAFAYGSDAGHIALRLQELGTDYFAVAYAEEGVALREAGIEKPILVLHSQPVNFDLLLQYHLEPSIYSQHILKQFSETVKKQGETGYPVHLNFNTGLNRLGFGSNDIEFIVDLLKSKKELDVTYVFSHLAASEDLNEADFTQRQLTTFKNIALEIDQRLGYTPSRHLLNTSGIINYSEAQYDMVRSGIGLYGYGNDDTVDASLIPVATLKTVISQIHRIAPGETVGYNRAFASDNHRITATLPLGHADGIGRHYGNGKTHVLVHGQIAPIVGNVCMDMIMIDVTDIDCREGDEVILFGKELSAQKVATNANTISYELLTGVSQRIKRKIIGQS